MRNAWHMRSLMPVTPRQDPRRNMLLEGRLVVRFEGMVGLADDGPGANISEVHWAHIGLHFQNPKQTVFFELAFVGERGGFTELEVARGGIQSSPRSCSWCRTR